MENDKMDIPAKVYPCRDCGALGDCCEASAARLQYATSLSRLVDHQGDWIKMLTNRIDEAQKLLSEMRDKGAA